MENLKLWNAVEETNPAHTKQANVRGNKITAIAPQRQIKNATEQFGVYGSTWGFKSIEFDYAMVSVNNVIVFKGVFFFPNGEFPIVTSIGAYMDKALKMPDQDFAKKAETDALTKALSKLGFNADVFMGLYDDHKYVQMMNDQFNKPEPNDNDKGWIEGIKSGDNKLEEIQDPVYRARIQLFIKEGY